MRITKWGEYGILCCLEIARVGPGASCGAAEIAPNLEIPLQYAQQILQRLRKGGVIESIRGPGGGYRLARRAAETSLKDVLRAAEGTTFTLPCDSDEIFSDCSQSSSSCGLKIVWCELQSSIDAVLEGKSLASVLALENSDLVPAPKRSD